MSPSLRRLHCLLCAVALGGCTEERASIDADGVYFGELLLRSAQLEDGSRFATHTIELQAGEELDAILQTTDFDAYLRLQDAYGNLIGEDDDSAGGTNAQLIAVAPDTATYTLVASSYSAEAYGDYVLAVRRRMSENAVEVYSGVLEPAGGKALQIQPAPVHEVSAAAGETLQVQLTAAAFDAYLEIRDAAGALLAEDDDGGGGTNARVSLPIHRSGTYSVLVRSFEDSGSGNYTLTVAKRIDAATAEQSSAQRFSGLLSAASTRLDDGTPYATHIIEATAGDQLEIEMSSEHFDSFVHLWSLEEHSLGGDDDSGGGLDSKLSVIAPADGHYLIVANSVGADAVGSYEIAVRRKSIDAELAGGNVELLSGMLTGRLGMLADGTPMATHEIQARAGERFKVAMTTGEFDAYLVVFDSDDRKIVEDDDSGGGTNARLAFVAPRDGTYRIAANSYGTDAYGAYTILLERD